MADPKVFTIDDTIYACSGDFPFARDAAQWIREGANPKAMPKGDWEVLVWRKGKKPRVYGSPDNHTGINLTLPACLGSGGRTALAALYAGVTPEEAMAVAYRLDIYSSGPTQKLYVKEFFQNVKRERVRKNPTTERSRTKTN
jgi:hypothetical protein